MFSEKTFFPSERGQAERSIFPGIFAKQKSQAEGSLPWAFTGAKGQAESRFPWGFFATAKKGQLSAEMIGISAVIMILFLIVVLIVWQRGLYTNLIGNVNQNTQLCNKLSKIIADFNSNPGYSETMMELEAKVKIEARSITVNPDNCPNCQYCYYGGTVAPNLPLTLPRGVYLIDINMAGVKFTCNGTAGTPAGSHKPCA